MHLKTILNRVQASRHFDLHASDNQPTQNVHD